MHILLSCTMYYKVLLKTFSESQSSFFLPKALCHSPLVSSTASVLFSILLKDCVLAALTTSKANIFNSFLPRHKRLCKKYFKNVESILWGSAITPWENITALILLLVSITGNVFPILWPFFFFWEIRLGEESGCVEQKQSWTNFCTAQTHTQHVPMAALRHGTKQRLLLSRAGSKDR